MERKLSFAVMLALFFHFNVQAQEKFISNITFGIGKGFTESIVQKKPMDSNIDFMNYFYRYPLLLADSYTGLSANVSFRNGVEFNFQTQMQYHVNLKNVRLSLQYFPRKNIGYNLGFYRYEQVFTGFYAFPFTENAGLAYVIADMKAKQRFFDRAVYTGIVARKTIRKFRFEGKFNSGACIFSPLEISLFMKQEDNNLIKKIEYHTAKTWYGYIQPELMLGYDLYKTQNLNFGIEWKASAIFSNRTVAYDKIVYTWTADNYTSLYVSPESHFYFRYNWDLGIFIQW